MFTVHCVRCPLCSLSTVFTVHCVRCSLCSVFMIYTYCSLCPVSIVFTLSTIQPFHHVQCVHSVHCVHGCTVQPVPCVHFFTLSNLFTVVSLFGGLWGLDRRSCQSPGDFSNQCEIRTVMTGSPRGSLQNDLIGHTMDQGCENGGNSVVYVDCSA